MSRKTSKLSNPVLNNEYFVKLLEIEEQYQSGIISHTIISSLTEIYATCIEYYDRFQDPVSVYFHEKLQSLLSSSKTIQALYIAQKQTNEEPKKIVTSGSFSPQNYQSKQADLSMPNVIQSAPDLQNEVQMKKQEKEDLQKILMGSKDSNPEGKILESLTKKRKERSTKLNIIMQMQEQKQTCEEVQVIELIDNYEKTANEADSIIQNSLKDQGDQLNQRLEKRKFTQRIRTHSLAGGDYKFQTASRDKLQNLEEIPDYISQFRKEYGK